MAPLLAELGAEVIVGADAPNITELELNANPLNVGVAAVTVKVTVVVVKA